jgi:hypothetical protein
MIRKIDKLVSVVSVYNHARNKMIPKKVFFEGEIHEIAKIGLYHTYRKGKALYHVFSVTSDKLFFRLILNSENLSWKIEQISDGEPE